jgi:hypothetical protein
VSERCPSAAGNSFTCFTCEYCFSHYVAAGVLAIAQYRLLFPDWRGYLVAFFCLVWISNVYMSVYNRLRLDIKHEKVEIKADEQRVNGVNDKDDELKINDRRVA